MRSRRDNRLPTFRNPAILSLPLLFLEEKKDIYVTMSRVPAPIRMQPSSDLGVNSSCRNTNARSSVITTLSLSIGTTFDASPICNAR